MNKLLSKLANAGYNAFKVTLQTIITKDGRKVWAYSTMQPRVQCDIVGGHDINCSVSIIDPSVPKAQSASGLWITLWLNDCDDEMSELYRDSLGSECVVIVNTADDVTQSTQLFTVDDASQLLVTSSDSTSTSQQASAS